MVVFGGSTGPGAALVPQGDIYVLDLSSMTWNQGDSVSSSEFRAGMACSGVENNFIAWGGKQIKALTCLHNGGRGLVY
jgi:hypothetical protein